VCERLLVQTLTVRRRHQRRYCQPLIRLRFCLNKIMRRTGRRLVRRNAARGTDAATSAGRASKRHVSAAADRPQHISTQDIGVHVGHCPLNNYVQMCLRDIKLGRSPLDPLCVRMVCYTSSRIQYRPF